MISENELEIIGEWIFDGQRMHADDNCKRIHALTSLYLERIARDENGWDVLYQDPADKRYWEYTYPNKDMQGDGPPALIVISEYKARKKYSW
ncbi:hypothetical protein DJ568_03780 [Mucilaginibacter hurinus]|uniref:Immunity protein 27 of polymorphic toxin system n=1 Tax=Mucilaginibacter hurinus TaxID=2201324 RepID=A0A367GR11_9SPHI|nr:Imm27 family immunity protein [Mucilaginibacter hurinus]RCH55882.1 hypothetical protein DJ568_03780 [Mucilaginibacter hurinus]